MACIILATDFSPHADRAFLRSLLMAKHARMDLLFAHAIGDGLTPAIRIERRTAAEARLRALCDAASAQHGLPVAWQVLDGAPDAVLAALAADRGAHLLIVGPHDPEPIRDLLLGSMASKLLKQLPCPLLFANGMAVSPYRRVLLATDLSPHGSHAAGTAASLLLGQDPEFILYHAFDLRPYGGIAASTGSRAAAELDRNQLRSTMEQDLSGLAAAAGISRYRLVAEPAERSAATMILRAATAASADLVVAGTQGKSATERFLLGSVAEELLRDAKQDLLLVPPPAHSADPSA